MTQTLRKRSSISSSGWRALADSIILQAVEDYRRLSWRRVKRPYDIELRREITRIERFFRSDWFSALCDLDGNKLLRDLRADMGIAEVS